MTDESKLKTPPGRNPFGNTLTAAQVAALKGCKIQSVHEAIWRGDLRAWRFGAVYAIPKREAEAWTLVGHRKKRAG